LLLVLLDVCENHRQLTPLALSSAIKEGGPTLVPILILSAAFVLHAVLAVRSQSFARRWPLWIWATNGERESNSRVAGRTTALLSGLAGVVCLTTALLIAIG
jgi:hypothetical protein